MNKKQKRLLGEARQKAQREASINSGLQAQARDREMRAKKAREAKAEEARKQASAAAPDIKAMAKPITRREFENTGRE